MSGSDAYGSAAYIDDDAIAASVGACVAAAPTAAVLAVVKADAYGHGLVGSARAALRGGASWLGTAHLAEALALRAAGIEERVLSWLNPPGTAFDAALTGDIDIAVSAPWAVDDITAAVARTGATARIHLKIDTGLRRNGVGPEGFDELADAAAAARATGAVEIVGVMTHFVHADHPDHPTNDRQLEAFDSALKRLSRKGIEPEIRHCANSAATLTRPDAHYDLVRPGLACFGLTPVPQLGGPERFGLVPAMTLSAPVVLTKSVRAGEGVSYGHVWIADHEGTLALVPLGYADGVPRQATNIAEVLIHGCRERIAGRVCMDQFAVTCHPDTAPGEQVVLFGPGNRGEPTAQDWADALDTISYEIVTRIGPRVPRIRVSAGVPTG